MGEVAVRGVLWAVLRNQLNRGRPRAGGRVVRPLFPAVLSACACPLTRSASRRRDRRREHGCGQCPFLDSCRQSRVLRGAGGRRPSRGRACARTRTRTHAGRFGTHLGTGWQRTGQLQFLGGWGRGTGDGVAGGGRYVLWHRSWAVLWPSLVDVPSLTIFSKCFLNS